MFLKKIRKNNANLKVVSNGFSKNLKNNTKPVIKFLSLVFILLSVNVSSIPNQINWFEKDSYASEFHFKMEYEDERVTNGLFRLLDNNEIDTKTIRKNLDSMKNK